MLLAGAPGIVSKEWLKVALAHIDKGRKPEQLKEMPTGIDEGKEPCIALRHAQISFSLRVDAHKP